MELNLSKDRRRTQSSEAKNRNNLVFEWTFVLLSFVEMKGLFLCFAITFVSNHKKSLLKLYELKGSERTEQTKKAKRSENNLVESIASLGLLSKSECVWYKKAFQCFCSPSGMRWALKALIKAYVKAMARSVITCKWDETSLTLWLQFLCSSNNRLFIIMKAFSSQSSLLFLVSFLYYFYTFCVWK